MTREQRRGRAIAMTPAEIDTLLAVERTCRVATVDGEGRPHVTPLWFVWDGEALWLSSLVRSQRWTDLERAPQIAVVVDAGSGYQELRGVELRGVAEVVGAVPRTEPGDEDVAVPEELFARKYSQGEFKVDGRHAWLRVVPEKLTSWDFRKSVASAPRR